MRAVVFLAMLLTAACAPAAPPVTTPAIDRTAELGRAALLVETGCLDCLLEADGVYDALRRDPVVGPSATLSMIRTALLIGLRERDLGLVDGGHLARARRLLDATPEAPSSLVDLVGLAEAIPAADAVGRRGHSPQILLRLRPPSGADRVATGAGDNGPLLGYLWLSAACHPANARAIDSGEALAALGELQALPLLAYKHLAACGRPGADALTAFLEREPKFHELHYDLGLAAFGLVPDLDEVEAQFDQAYAWRQDWPALTLHLANVMVTAEDFAGALTFFDRTLAMAPDQPDAILGRVRSLTYLARPEDAMAAADQLLALGRYPGDARYWRALNRFRQARYDESWAEVEVALTLLINADVFKLAGIVAMHRGEPDVARRHLDDALSRNPDDCEIGFYRQVLLSDAREWPGAAQVAEAAGACFDAVEARLRGEIERARAADLTEHRRGLQIASREYQIAANDRMRAACWFNAAAAHFNLGDIDEARRLAALVARDDRFGARARDLLSRER